MKRKIYRNGAVLRRGKGEKKRRIKKINSGWESRKERRNCGKIEDEGKEEVGERERSGEERIKMRSLKRKGI
jgi:hypothetical protein